MLAQAKSQNEELERLRTVARPGGSKYPTYEDRVRGLRDFYKWKADTMASLARKYEARLSPAEGNEQSRGAAVAAKVEPQLSPTEKMLLERIEQLEKQIGPAR